MSGTRGPSADPGCIAWLVPNGQGAWSPANFGSTAYQVSLLCPGRLRWGVRSGGRASSTLPRMQRARGWPARPRVRAVGWAHKERCPWLVAWPASCSPLPRSTSPPRHPPCQASTTACLIICLPKTPPACSERASLGVLNLTPSCP